jgi:hypothetical protein
MTVDLVLSWSARQTRGAGQTLMKPRFRWKILFSVRRLVGTVRLNIPSRVAVCPPVLRLA